jgi:CYTH domain-containing protein
VALRLQLDEFGEFKFLKKGAVLPEVRVSKESAPVGYEDWMGSDIIMDYQAHDEGLSDPDLWTVQAEERRAWSTEAILLENNPGP